MVRSATNTITSGTSARTPISSWLNNCPKTVTSPSRLQWHSTVSDSTAVSRRKATLRSSQPTGFQENLADLAPAGRAQRRINLDHNSAPLLRIQVCSTTAIRLARFAATRQPTYKWTWLSTRKDGTSHNNE